ncbi:MAG: putative DNA binding domain-containing protein [Candidatus Scalindua sp.]|nr:putative DNA binding domain-containing protein [Candidatus Scalindua sp.]MCR4343742.1 putative DNA binding domain-containing protein [Candidatus Scalindua sp.]
MNAIELLDIINTGETSKVQFKQTMPHPDSIASEMGAFSNTMGGMILFGIKDITGEITGLSYEEIQKYSQNIGNYATNNIIPGIYVKTEVVPVAYNGERKILIVYIDEGINKPYKDLNRDVWVKQGSDKRRVTDNAEMLRLFQQGSHLLADEIEVYDTSIEDVTQELFRDYLKNAPIRIMIFDNRVEVMSPGILPNSLTVEEAMFGNPVIRNSQIVKFSSHTMPFSGIGTGLTRALKEEPDIGFNNDIDGVQFIVKFPRPEIDI